MRLLLLELMMMYLRKKLGISDERFEEISRELLDVNC